MLEAFLSSGRSTLQKRVMALLRRIEHPTPGNIDVTFSLIPDGDHDVSEWRFWLTILFYFFPPTRLQAWEDACTKWDLATKQILNCPKNKADDGQVRM